MAAAFSHCSAVKALQKDLKDLNENPVEGFRVQLLDENNLFTWDVAIFGPPQTIYEGGYFKARLVFPSEYPYQPPTMKFISRMFHPNIYENGDVCISILHPPGDDPSSGEMASERWNPTQSVRTILLSVISMLNEPNINSSAHVNASVAYRRWKQSGGEKDDYESTVRQLVENTKGDAIRDNVKVPETLEEYCMSGKSVDGHIGISNDSEDIPDDCLGDDIDDYDYDSDTEDVGSASGSEMFNHEHVNANAPSSSTEVSKNHSTCTRYVEDGLVDEGLVGSEPPYLLRDKVDLSSPNDQSLQNN